MRDFPPDDVVELVADIRSPWIDLAYAIGTVSALAAVVLATGFFA